MSGDKLPIVERLRNRPNDCPLPAEYLMDEAATTITELVSAMEAIMIGGNHLALLIGADHPPYTAEPSEALTHYGAGDTYEIWCCWRSIMLARDAVNIEDFDDA